MALILIDKLVVLETIKIVVQLAVTVFKAFVMGFRSIKGSETTSMSFCEKLQATRGGKINASCIIGIRRFSVDATKVLL